MHTVPILSNTISLREEELEQKWELLDILARLDDEIDKLMDQPNKIDPLANQIIKKLLYPSKSKTKIILLSGTHNILSSL
jgi:hypothetical protein